MMRSSANSLHIHGLPVQKSALNIRLHDMNVAKDNSILGGNPKQRTIFYSAIRS